MISNLFLSVGAMKAGTTWLFEQLRDHPDIYFTPEKEIHYFTDMAGIDPQLSHVSRVNKLQAFLKYYSGDSIQHLCDNLENVSWFSDYAQKEDIDDNWYKNLFRFNPGKKYCADFSNIYCQMSSAHWARAYGVTDRLKVIYTLRDPLSRIWSHYKFHMKWTGHEDEVISMGFENFKFILNEPWFWVNAEYARNYTSLLQGLRKDDLLVLYFEDFRLNPQHELDRVQEFLEISKIEIPEDKLKAKVNDTKEFRFPEEWKGYALNKLKPICNEMKDLGIWHPNWKDLA